ncbi:MAG: SDR family oxidoreductase [Bryobacterales bacterium]|nr:SDR family oxidoreductase [Bryobacterales bacterium]
MNLELDGHVAVVTGGASGIGLACAQTLAREGCRVAVWDVNAQVTQVARTLEDAYGIHALGLVADVTHFDGVKRCLREVEDALGSIVHLVHAAAIGSGKYGFPFTNLEPADWRRVLEVNIMGMVNVAHAVAPGMVERKAGTMVFLGSIAGQIGSPTDPPYSASKAANINFAHCLAKDLAPHGIRVNIVNPGMVQTPLNRSVWEAWNRQQPEEKQRSYKDWAGEKVRTVAPLARWQTVEDVADMVAFLSSARAAQVTGQSINVDGGQVIRF